MIRLIIIVLGGILMYVTGSNGEWGPFAVVLVVTLALLGMGSIERKDARAWYNRTDYWSKDGKDRYKARQRWREEAEAEERAKREREAERARARHDRQMARMVGKERWENASIREKAKLEVERITGEQLRKSEQILRELHCDDMLEQPVPERDVRPPVRTVENGTPVTPVIQVGEKIYTCPVCRRKVYSTARTVWISGRKYDEIYCPYCRKARTVYVG